MSSGYSPYTKLISSILFPLHERMKGHDTVEVLNRLEKSQWLSVDEIIDVRNKRLTSFLLNIQKNVPYYNRLFSENGIDVASIRSTNGMHNIPFLTKDIIRENESLLMSGLSQSLAEKKTGGSTGSPLRFYVDSGRISHDVAARWRALRWWDADIGDRELVLWGAPAELATQDYVRVLRDTLFRSRLVSAFDLSRKNMEYLAGLIKRFKPKTIFGYPSTLAYLSRYSRTKNLSFVDCGINVVFVTSEVLYPDQRSDISEVFGCPVANEYGGRDSGFIARECPEGKMHVSAEDIIVEIVDEKGRPVKEGMPGEVVITHLGSLGFPFLRYKTGDIAVMDGEPCPCGRGLPVLKEIIGRSNDLLLARDGSVVHPNVVNYIVREFKEVLAYKVIQKSIDQLDITLEVISRLVAEEEKKLKLMFAEKLGDGVSVKIEYVDSIQTDASGKHRFVISHCKTNI